MHNAGVSPAPRPRALGGLAVAALLSALWLLWLLRSAPGGAPAPQPTITILIWHWPFASQPPELPSNTCSSYGVAHCRLTTNRSLLASAHAVVFHHRELQTRQARLPLAERPQGQPWVWASMESPSHTRGLGRLRGVFNWVLSYRRDSDIFVPYGRLEPREGPAPPLPAKSRVAAWVVSNFQERQRRVQLYRQLAPHLQVDVFGRASKQPLCADCLLPTVARYLFYLSFENSQHRDYITEKFWRNALLAGTVPVVLGPSRVTYEAFAPPDAFVHVDDFGSAHELAAFLAGMNESRYRRYFAWRDRLRVRLFGDWRERFCAICARYPHLPRGQAYQDLEGWFQA
ncbi:alpha-(1,3)-fucosyltransferase 7 [Globicephala melas]|uniref:Fucosyltransferase n=1 Tax=Tursiops truncatus TaxID=9739 RepID=A0A2U4B7W3_TURTR|nr:alpha-(1,3)-fucosyltransferase 7 [Tursiops truncatus]XP_030694096.1 alpha-(1,3)-fucosyltransferase 7 [Globicephala melas]XP_030694097.1 alpha-(1,3)-fucosyltransferase 7 [Globicephala melas]XP_033715024.1 alpha-(1,3)-fucosyltransferase 7 [Tursiops truncatus]XP_059869220.1 alpha-(1,3)-fucosyltransferase 7 [Delphinus delphis]